MLNLKLFINRDCSLDNGSSYILCELADWIEDNEMSHVLGAPYHPQSQEKIERCYQALKNRLLLEHYFLPGVLQRQIETFVDRYNHQRYHESLKKADAGGRLL